MSWTAGAAKTERAGSLGDVERLVCNAYSDRIRSVQLHIQILASVIKNCGGWQAAVIAGVILRVDLGLLLPDGAVGCDGIRMDVVGAYGDEVLSGADHLSSSGFEGGTGDKSQLPI